MAHPIRDLGGYTFTRWTGADHDTFEQWIRDRRVDRVRKALASARGLAPEQRERLVADVAMRPVGITDIIAELRSHQAQRFAIRLSLRQHHPDLTDPELEAIEIGAGGTLDLMGWIIGIDAITKPDPDPDEEDPHDPPAMKAPPDSQHSPPSSAEHTPHTPSPPRHDA